MGINYASDKCGRTSKHISFADKLSMDMVGVVREYGISVIQTYQGAENTVSSMTKAAYRIPFYADVSGQVTTIYGTGVPNVIISFCHIDPNTGLQSEVAGECPLKKFVTDKRGEFSGTIQVSQPSWVLTLEYFNVTASLIDVMKDGSQFVHEFATSSKVVRLRHRQMNSVTFQDISAISVFGSVIYDPTIVGGNKCPFSGVPIILVNENGKNQTTNSAKNGTFTFSISRGQSATIYIPEYNGYSWNSNIVNIVNSARTLLDVTSSVNSKRELSTPTTNMLEVIQQKLETKGGSEYSSRLLTYKSASLINLNPSSRPSIRPITIIPSTIPSLRPTLLPSNVPSKPTLTPTLEPTSEPTNEPTAEPSTYPSNKPSTGII
jgi:hypothetical protein